jgi:hypothetical protein
MLELGMKHRSSLEVSRLLPRGKIAAGADTIISDKSLSQLERLRAPKPAAHP